MIANVNRLRSSADRLRAAAAIKVTSVVINGETFHVRSMSGAERAQFWADAETAKKDGKMMSDADIAAIGFCEEDGTAVFKTKQAAVEALGEIDGTALNALANAVMSASGLGKNAVEEAVKN